MLFLSTLPGKELARLRASLLLEPGEQLVGLPHLLGKDDRLLLLFPGQSSRGYTPASHSFKSVKRKEQRQNFSGDVVRRTSVNG
jgi:hypothetical protein